MAKSFLMHQGDTVFADGKPILTVNRVLESPFHITVTPKKPNPRRLDINSSTPIKILGETVMLKVGEPILMDADFSVMPTRIYNYEQPYCRVSVRCPQHINLTTDGRKQGR